VPRFRSQSPNDVIHGILRNSMFGMLQDVKLCDVEGTDGNPHAKKLNRKLVKAAPNNKAVPSFLLYRLGESKFVKGSRLEDFRYVRDGSKCVVLLGPSGGGKTRKLFEFLHNHVGYFIPYRIENDKNDGSFALTRVIEALMKDDRVHWMEKHPSLEEYNARRELAEFALRCVLAAYTAVFNHWDATQEKPNAMQWLLIQLFPSIFLGGDLFATLAMQLFNECPIDSPLECMRCPCVLDEAQEMGKLQKDMYYSILSTRLSSHLRPLLSPILSGVRAALGRAPMIAGTGLTLMEEWKSVISSQGTTIDFLYTDFPLLRETQVREMLTTFLLVQGQHLTEAVGWLTGRPRFVVQFISDVFEKQSSIDDTLKAYVKRVTTQVSNSKVGTPRTIAESFARLDNGLRVIHVMDKRIVNPYSHALIDTFWISCGLNVPPAESPALLELGIGYAVPKFVEPFVDTLIEPEPLVLETARLLREKAHDEFDSDLLLQVRENESALGKRFEYVGFIRLCQYLCSTPLEENSLLSGLSPVVLPLALAGNSLLSGHSPSLPLASAFRGRWEQPVSKFGRIAVRTGGKELYDWLESALNGHDVPGAFFPSDQAGPDALGILHQSNRVLLLVVQFKLVNSFSDPEIEQAMLRMDPSKFNHSLRGALPGPGKGNERVIKKYQKRQETLMNTMDELNVSVVRILVSGMTEMAERKAEWVSRGNHSDLVLFVDSSCADQVFGKRFMEEVKKVKA